MHMFFDTNNDDGTCLRLLLQWVTENGGKAFHDDTDFFIQTDDGNIRAEVGDKIQYDKEGVFSVWRPVKVGQ